jgi:putative SOS response-associated peptidase YedK
MCGRYSSARSDSEIASELGVKKVVDDEPRPSWNVAPTQQRRIVVERGESDDHEATRTLRTSRWGLMPAWAKDIKIGHRLINARSETLLSKPAFRSAAVRRRALIPADGYFEWEKVDGKKVPYFLHHPDETLMTFGGLYELWPEPERDTDDPDRWMWTYTIITRPAQDSLGHIHDRAPLVIPTEQWSDWLDPTNTERDAIAELIDAIPDPELAPRRVGSAVGSVRNNSPDLVTPAVS